MRKIFLALLLALVAMGAGDVGLSEPKDVAAQLSTGAKPVILYAGPNVLYRSKHIPGAIYAGPDSRPEGLELLKSAVAKLPKTQEIVLYCGCCPWDKCPNMKPAMELLRSMGFAHVTAMHVPTSFKVDWIDAGYPVEQ